MPPHARTVSSPALAVLGGLAGVALQLQQPHLWPGAEYALVVAAGLAACAWLTWQRPLWAGGWVFLAAVLLGGGSTGWRASVYQAQGLAPALEGRDILVVGQVQGLPQPGAEMLRFRLRVETATMDGQATRLPPRLALAWYAPRRGAAVDLDDATESSRLPADLQPGERWRMTVRLKAPHSGLNPHGFDQELAWWEQGVQAVGYVRNGLRDTPPQRLSGGNWSVDRLRQSARSAIQSRVPDRQLAGILSALVMGDQAAIERSDWDVFRATGVAHLMSISGLHITLFAWLATRVLRGLWRSSVRWTPAWCLAVPAHRAGAWGGLMLSGAYAVFAGWGVPAQRTVLMLAVAVLLQQGARRWPWPLVALVAMGVVVAVDPWALLQPGFWLSFVAVGVLMATDPQEGQRKPPGPAMTRTPGGRAWRAVLVLMREQWLVTLALAPLCLLLFQQVSLVGLLANALAIPWVTWLVTPLALLGTLFPPLWTAAALLLDLLMAVLRPLAEWPGAVLFRAAAPLWCGVAGAVGGLLLVMRWPWYVRLQGVPLMLPVLLWQPVRPAPGQVELLALDVGQGSAVLVRTARHSLLYDAGPRYSRESDAGHRVVVPVLRALGERLDMLVLSHEDSDHIGGAAAVQAGQPRARVLASFGTAAGLPGVAPQLCDAGLQWTWDGVSFEFLHPAADLRHLLKTPNSRSCVLRVRTSGPVPATALLTGDLEVAQELALLQRQSLKADWMLVPHHGSRTSSSEVFLDAVQPRWAVVQAGYRNRFGHPAPEVVARYRARGIGLMATPHCGAGSWRSAQPEQFLCQRLQARRYWHHGAALDAASVQPTGGPNRVVTPEKGQQ